MARQDIAARSGRPKGRHSLLSRSLLLGLVAIVGAIGPSKSLASSGEAIPKSAALQALAKSRSQAQRIALGDAALRLFVLTCVCASIA
jgi:hypothetical protein